jgi:hypothetical protein
MNFFIFSSGLGTSGWFIIPIPGAEYKYATIPDYTNVRFEA